jgi:hypothetical protein
VTSIVTFLLGGSGEAVSNSSGGLSFVSSRSPGEHCVLTG